MNPHKRDEEIIKHYARSMGRERRAIAFRDTPSPAPDPIVVVEYPPPNKEYDWVYATIGMSRKPMPGPENLAAEDVERRIELMMYANQADEELPSLMLRLALIPFVNNSSLEPGDTVTGISNDGIIKGSPLTEMLIAHPFFESQAFRIIHHADGSHTDILWVIPLHTSERLYAKSHGSRALLKLFNANQTDTSDFWRSPVI